MRQIRRCIFETNSSSTHSISVGVFKGQKVNDMLISEDGYIYAFLGKFGWEVEDYTSQYDKLSYLLTMAAEINGFHIWCCDDQERKELIEAFQKTDDFQRISKAVVEQAGCDGVILGIGEGYIDHKSYEAFDSLDDFLNYNDVDIKDFIFNPNVVVHTGNDNEWE